MLQYILFVPYWHLLDSCIYKKVNDFQLLFTVYLVYAVNPIVYRNAYCIITCRPYFVFKSIMSVLWRENSYGCLLVYTQDKIITIFKQIIYDECIALLSCTWVESFNKLKFVLPLWLFNHSVHLKNYKVLQ